MRAQSWRKTLPHIFLCFLWGVDYRDLLEKKTPSVGWEQQTPVINIWSVISFWGSFVETFSVGLRHCSSKIGGDKTLPLQSHYSAAVWQKSQRINGFFYCHGMFLTSYVALCSYRTQNKKLIIKWDIQKNGIFKNKWIIKWVKTHNKHICFDKGHNGQWINFTLMMNYMLLPLQSPDLISVKRRRVSITCLGAINQF